MQTLPTKALSVRQPWAWAIIFGGKDIENRTSPAMRHLRKHRGSLAIHASIGMTRNEYEAARSWMQEIGVVCPRPDELVRGAIIGTVDVVDAVAESKSPWFFGPRGLALANPQSYVPRLCQGQLGYFNWQDKDFTEFQEPKPWMKAWPSEKHRIIREETTTPLFGENLPQQETHEIPEDAPL